MYRSGSITITRDLVLVGVTFGLIYMLYQGVLTFLPTYLVEQGRSLVQAGGLSSVMFFVGFAAQPLGGLIYDRFGGRVLMTGSATIFGIALWVLASPQISATGGDCANRHRDVYHVSGGVGDG